MGLIAVSKHRRSNSIISFAFDNVYAFSSFIY